MNWTRLSCHGFRNNEVDLLLHVLAYNMVNFLRTPAHTMRSSTDR
jgi:hypothetical protein